MANIKSAKKRILVTETKAARNKAIKSKVKTAVKKVETAVAEKNVEAAKARVFITRKQFPERSLVFPKLLTLALNYK